MTTKTARTLENAEATLLAIDNALARAADGSVSERETLLAIAEALVKYADG